MKKLLLAFVMLGCFYAGYSADGDAVVEFRKILWGTPKDSILMDGKHPQFVKDKSSIIKNAYSILNDDLTIGTVKLEKVLYIFNDDNRFYKVFLQGAVDQTEQMKFILN